MTNFANRTKIVSNDNCWRLATKQIRGTTLALTVLISALTSSCFADDDDIVESASCDLAIVESSLHSIAADLHVWDAYLEAATTNEGLEIAIAQSVIADLVVIRAMHFSLEDLKGRPLEALCRTTQADVQRLIERHPNPVPRSAALSFLQEIGPHVRERVSEIQSNLHGEGCDLAPK